MRGLKSVLGAVKRRAEQATGRELRNVVHRRPVHFVDNAPDADRKAERTLREIAREVSLDEVTWMLTISSSTMTSMAIRRG